MLRPLSLVAALALLAGCGGVNANGDPQPPRVRVVHGIPDAGPLDILVDGVAIATAVPYGASAPRPGSDGFTITTGAHSVSVVRGGVTLLNLPNIVVTQDDLVTVVAAGTLATPKFVGATDDRQGIAPDQSDLRIFHAASRLPELVDVYVTRSDQAVDLSNVPPTASSLGRFGTLGPFRSTSGEYRIRITEPGLKAVIAEGRFRTNNGLNILTVLDDDATPLLKYAVTGR